MDRNPCRPCFLSISSGLIYFLFNHLGKNGTRSGFFTFCFFFCNICYLRTLLWRVNFIKVICLKFTPKDDRLSGVAGGLIFSSWSIKCKVVA